MTFKDLGKKINIDGIRIVPFDFDLNKFPINIAYIKTVSRPDEQEAYAGLDDEKKKDFISKSAFIYLPYNEVDEIFDTPPLFLCIYMSVNM